MNETTVEVTLPEGFKATEADLVGKTITVKAGDKTLTATYSEKSLDKEGKAVFTLADGEKLEDAVEYTASADWAEFTDATFVAKTAEAHVAEFVKVTEKVASNLDKDGKKPEAGKETKIAFAAKDQYGEEISLDKATALSVTGTVNGMPLTANEIKLTGKTSPVVVDFELKEGDTLEFTVVDTKDNKKVAETTFTYEVAKAEKAVVSSIELKTTDNKTSAPSGEKIEFEATAYNQFKSPDATAKLRWVVNGKEVEADKGTSNKFTLKETTPGEYKVQVFSTDNTKVKAEKTVTIGAAELKTLELKPAVELKDEDVKVTETDKRFNKEELVIGTLKPNEGAALVASNVKFHVTTSDKNLTKDDIKVTAEEAETTDGKKVIVVKATTTKAGSFQVTPFVGEEFTADKTVKASASTTIETKVNPEIATIEDITFDAKDLKAGTSVKKAIEFKNKHGEVLTADQVNTSLKLTSSNDKVLKNENVKVEQGKKDVEGEDVNKTYITFTSEKEAKGTTVLTIQAGAVVKTHTLNFVGATLTKIDAGSKVTGVVAGDTADKAKYNEINFLDQDGKKMAPQTAEVTVTDAKGDNVEKSLVKLGTVTKNDKGEITAFNENTNAPTHAQILANDTDLAQGTYNVTVTSKVKDTNGKEVEVKGSFQVVVDEARAAKTVEVKAKASTVTVDGTTTLTIVPKDQYGDIVTDAKENLVVKGDEFVTKVGDVTAIDKDGNSTEKAEEIVAYQVTVKGAKKGTGTVKVDVKGTKDDKEVVLATGSQSIKVDSVGNVIESVEIEEVKEVQSTNKAEATVELKATGKDAAGNDVAIAKEDLTWSIKSVKDADGKEVKLDADGKVLDKDGKIVDGKEVKIDKDGKLTVSQGLTVEVEAEVTSANQKKATTVVKFEGADAVYTKDLTVSKVGFGATEATDAKDLEDKGLKLTFGKESIKDNSAEITVTFTGVDQYGEEYKFKTAEELTVATEDRSVATATAGANGAVTLTVADMVQEGDKTFINVTAGKDTVKLEVTVSKEVADMKKKTLK